MVTLPGDALDRYERFSVYNSPYVSHDRGCAIDLYPEAGPGRARRAPSPVAGEVVDTRAVRAPPKEYAVEDDYLTLIAVDPAASDLDVPDGTVARTLHVEPSVAPGDRVAVGDSLGTLVRAGFFAPWVDNHVHLGFRAPDANAYRASGSLPLDVSVDVEPLPWDGTGTVRAVGDTYAVLDAPAHPAPGRRFAGIAADGGGVLDGGLVHYEGGGVHGADGDGAGRAVSLLGRRVGRAEGRDVAWAPIAVYADGRRITGLSLFCARDAGFGAKLICPDRSFERGDRVTVDLRPTDEPTELG
jgi:hypothetical protein